MAPVSSYGAMPPQPHSCRGWCGAGTAVLLAAWPHRIPAGSSHSSAAGRRAAPWKTLGAVSVQLPSHPCSPGKETIHFFRARAYRAPRKEVGKLRKKSQRERRGRKAQPLTFNSSVQCLENLSPIHLAEKLGVFWRSGRKELATSCCCCMSSSQSPDEFSCLFFFFSRFPRRNQNSLCGISGPFRQWQQQQA